MPSPSWEKEGGSSAVLLPLHQEAGDRWYCKVLNYPRIVLRLTTEELETTWQTVPRIDPKWLNPGSRWVDMSFLMPPEKGLVHRVWPSLFRHSWVLDRVNGPEVNMTAHPDMDPTSRVMVRTKGLSLNALLTTHVRLWETPFPKEPVPFVYNAEPKRYRAPRQRAKPQLSAIDQILQDDD